MEKYFNFPRCVQKGEWVEQQRNENGGKPQVHNVYDWKERMENRADFLVWIWSRRVDLQCVLSKMCLR